jgi:regulatory protein
MAGQMAGTVTALKAQRGAKDRVNVYLDGEFAFGLALIHALWLKIGQSLSDEDIAELKAADTLEKAQQRALNLISYRPRTVKEVQQRLKKAGADDETITSVVERLKVVGLLSDEAFGRAWVESRLRSSPRGKRLIAWELRQKGMSRADIEAALQGADDAESAYRAALKRLPRLQSLEPHERKRKLSEFLARNGFDYGTIEDVLEKIEPSVDGDADH